MTAIIAEAMEPIGEEAEVVENFVEITQEIAGVQGDVTAVTEATVVEAEVVEADVILARLTAAPVLFPAAEELKIAVTAAAIVLSHAIHRLAAIQMIGVVGSQFVQPTIVIKVLKAGQMPAEALKAENVHA